MYKSYVNFSFKLLKKYKLSKTKSMFREQHYLFIYLFDLYLLKTVFINFDIFET